MPCIDFLLCRPFLNRKVIARFSHPFLEVRAFSDSTSAHHPMVCTALLLRAHLYRSGKHRSIDRSISTTNAGGTSPGSHSCLLLSCDAPGLGSGLCAAARFLPVCQAGSLSTSGWATVPSCELELSSRHRGHLSRMVSV